MKQKQFNITQLASVPTTVALNQFNCPRVYESEHQPHDQQNFNRESNEYRNSWSNSEDRKMQSTPVEVQTQIFVWSDFPDQNDLWSDFPDGN